MGHGSAGWGRPRPGVAGRLTRSWLVLLSFCGFAADAGAADLLSFLHEKDSHTQTATPCTFESIPLARPPGKGPTEVEIGVRVLDLIEIDDVAQAMTLDLVIFARWEDHRLGKLAAGRSCTLHLESIWNPNLVVAGERQLSRKLDDLVVVEPGGAVVYLQRLIGDLRATADLRAFPMDSRSLDVQIVAAGNTPDQVKFTPIQERTGFQPNPSVSNWVFGEERTKVAPYTVEDLGDIASCTFSIEARRRAAVYVWRLAVPIGLILMMSWIPFWMPPAEMGSRNSLAALAMLNMIAFQSVLRSMLPPVPYMTRADTIATGALILIFFALIESAATSILEFRGRTEAALRVNRISRFAFPLAAVAVVLMAIPG